MQRSEVQLPLRALHLPIRWRMALWSAALMAATLAVAAYLSFFVLSDALLREVDGQLAERADRIEQRVITGPPEAPLTLPASQAEMAVDAFDEFAAPGVYTQIYDATGRPLAASSNIPQGGLPQDSWAVAFALSGRSDLTTLPGGRDRLRALTRPLVSEGRTVGVIRVVASLHLLDTFLARFERLLLLVGFGGLVLAVFGGWALATRALHPVVELTRLARQTADEVDDGRLREMAVEPPSALVAALASDEIGVLASTFNVLLARLGATVRRQREFLADTSHELRNPLMVIGANLDLLDLDLPPEERAACLREAREEVARMRRLVADLLFLTEVDARDAIVHARVDLAGVARSVVRRSRPLPDGLELKLVLADPAVVLGDRDRLRQLLANLVENAIRYTPPPGEIVVSVRRKGEHVEVSVADSGIGIPPEHQGRIFDRFYRVDQARTRSLGGSGLGLAIVRQIAEAHGGQVRLISAVGAGSEFVVELPLVSPEAELAEAPVDARVAS
ncbi:MAG TPA: ATP-binding protein [Chloroflexota bacterium]